MYSKDKSENFNDFFFRKNPESTSAFDASVCDCSCICACGHTCVCDCNCGCDCDCDCDCSSGCFITTATLTSLGKDDNCIELTIFREFRDTYLKKQL